MATYLAIETSFDDTSLALITVEKAKKDLVEGKVISQVLFSQIDLHKEYGGVVPNIAKAAQSQRLIPSFKELAQNLLENSSFTSKKHTTVTAHFDKEQEGWFAKDQILLEQLQKLLQDFPVFPALDGILVTYGPGLEPALWTGVNFARGLAYATRTPLYGIHHMIGHLFSVYIQGDENSFSIPLNLDALALLVSGGHTQLMRTDGSSYSLLGETRDDAAGEAFDKVARLLGIPFPGGPHLDKIATSYRDKHPLPADLFPRPMLHSDNYDMSFSGLKTAVKRYLQDNTTHDTGNIAHQFQEAVCDVLIAKTRKALESYGCQHLIVAGGVSANKRLRERMQALCDDLHRKLHIPKIKYATDNASMIGVAGAYQIETKQISSIDPNNIFAKSRIPLV